MFKEIVNGISIKLNSEFDDVCEIYTENVEQGLEEPCFFIKSMNVINTPLLGTRKQRTYPFVITYFPKAGNAEMMDVSEKMMEALEYIELLNGDILRGMEMNSEIIDDLLQFKVSYKVILNGYVREESMNVVDVTVNAERD